MNFQLIIVHLCFTLIAIGFAKRARIIGGVDVNIKEIPYIVSLRQYEIERHFCAGVIVTNRHVLTAAHCIDNLNNDDYRVYAGSISSSDYEVPFYKVQHVRIHPTYLRMTRKELKARYDLAIIIVTPRIVFNQYQNKIALPTEDVPVGELGLISGWGWKTYPIGWISDNLQKLSMWIISNEACGLKFPNMITDQQVCVYRNREVGTCFGDSGGPLVNNGTLIGISSFARACATGDPDVYTKVYAFLDFIEPIIYCNCLVAQCICM